MYFGVINAYFIKMKGDVGTMIGILRLLFYFCYRICSASGFMHFFNKLSNKALALFVFIQFLAAECMSIIVKEVNIIFQTRLKCLEELPRMLLSTLWPFAPVYNRSCWIFLIGYF